MASEGRHRRPREGATTTAQRLVLAAGVTGAGLGVPLAAAGTATIPGHPADADAQGPAQALTEDLQNVSPAAAATTTAAAHPGAARPAGAPTIHVVAPGETLFGIARSRRVPGGWQSVYLDNREVIGDDPGLIRPGERLRLRTAPLARHPGGGTAEHIVRRGESLSSIAEEEEVDGGWQSVYLDNRELIGDDPNLIEPGWRLRLPADKATSPAPGASRTARPAAKASHAAGAPTHRPAHHPASGHHSAPRSAAHPAASASLRATLPVHGYTLTAGYRAVGSHWAHRHTGQDLAVPTGTRVVAVLGGTVVHAGWGGAYGNEVELRHHDGSYTVYGHLSSVAVRVGQTVDTGTRLGLSGATGNVTGPHLHFEVRNAPGYGSDIDPVAWLLRHGVHL